MNCIPSDVSLVPALLRREINADTCGPLRPPLLIMSSTGRVSSQIRPKYQRREWQTHSNICRGNAQSTENGQLPKYLPGTISKALLSKQFHYKYFKLNSRVGDVASFVHMEGKFICIGILYCLSFMPPEHEWIFSCCSVTCFVVSFVM